MNLKSALKKAVKTKPLPKYKKQATPKFKRVESQWKPETVNAGWSHQQ